jgi:hypothetical protein
MLLCAVLVSLLLMCGGLGLQYLHQAQILKQQVSQSRLAVQLYNTNVLPRLSVFVQNLQAFSKNNPDFTPVLARHGLLPGAQPAPAAPKK